MFAEYKSSGGTGLALCSSCDAVLLWVFWLLLASSFCEFGFSDSRCCSSQNVYRSDLNFMRGVACVIPGTLEIEGRKRASELISEVTGTGGGEGCRVYFYSKSRCITINLLFAVQVSYV